MKSTEFKLPENEVETEAEQHAEETRRAVSAASKSQQPMRKKLPDSGQRPSEIGHRKDKRGDEAIGNRSLTPRAAPGGGLHPRLLVSPRRLRQSRSRRRRIDCRRDSTRPVHTNRARSEDCRSAGTTCCRRRNRARCRCIRNEALSTVRSLSRALASLRGVRGLSSILKSGWKAVKCQGTFGPRFSANHSAAR